MAATIISTKIASRMWSSVAATIPAVAQAPCLNPADAARVVTIRTLRLGAKASRKSATNNPAKGARVKIIARSYFLAFILATILKPAACGNRRS
jgi:hypothetical protein